MYVRISEFNGIPNRWDTLKHFVSNSVTRSRVLQFVIVLTAVQNIFLYKLPLEFDHPL